MKDQENVPVGLDDDKIRLDRWFKRHFPALKHGALEKLLRGGQIRVDGKRVKSSFRVGEGAIVRVPPEVRRAEAEKPPKRRAEVSSDDAAALRETVLFKDDYLIAINKPAGLAVQGGSKTLRHLDGMLDALKFGKKERPKLVHRLDKDTSGVLLLARTAAAAAKLAAAFKSRETRKLYWALVAGVPRPAQGRIDLALDKAVGSGKERMIGGRTGHKAVTLYSVVDKAGGRAAWLALMPLTGRTHQLRAHCRAMAHPIIGDGKYGGQAAFLDGVAGRLHLHARSLSLPHPAGGVFEIIAPIGEHMAETWAMFGLDADNTDDPFDEAGIA